jgi:hypothetical protein
MPKPYVAASRKPLYGTQAQREDSTRSEEYRPVARHCVLCGEQRCDVWYELMAEGWVCDTCRPKATQIKRDPHSENHIAERI